MARPGRHPEQDPPGDAADKNLYDLPPEEAKEIPQVCGSLKEALEELDKGRAFLTKGGVFTDEFIDAYIELKSEEEIKVRTSCTRWNTTRTTASDPPFPITTSHLEASFGRPFMGRPMEKRKVRRAVRLDLPRSPPQG